MGIHKTVHSAQPTVFTQAEQFSTIALELFGAVPPGWPRGHAICNWVHAKRHTRISQSPSNENSLDVFTERLESAAIFSMCGRHVRFRTFQAVTRRDMISGCRASCLRGLLVPATESLLQCFALRSCQLAWSVVHNAGIIVCPHGRFLGILLVLGDCLAVGKPPTIYNFPASTNKQRSLTDHEVGRYSRICDGFRLWFRGRQRAPSRAVRQAEERRRKADPQQNSSIDLG